MKNQKGFSLIELCLVVGILVILASIVVPQYSRYKERNEREKAINSDNLYVKAGTAVGVVSYIDKDGEKTDLEITIVIDTAKHLPSGKLLTLSGGKFEFNTTALLFIEVSAQ
ncbi:MAG: prepilin-type N-terminal cleavage/methylation domain-containing protein [Patescibacteria group bacterium]|jgi:prepilin-type N-terminal cleavage/methylation domain-containing protein|nr:prepilin-type N-terminal cleavage/methylation domain-containing protein [Patescibacteria group bacterium]